MKISNIDPKITGNALPTNLSSYFFYSIFNMHYKQIVKAKCASFTINTQ